MGVQELAPCPQPPTMLTWAPIERNVLVENGQQVNIPYFGDDVIERDSKFISSLAEEVNHKISMSDNLTDELFLPLVAALARYPPEGGPGAVGAPVRYVVLFAPDSEREREWIKASKEDRTLPGLIVFQAIASKFPEFGTTGQTPASSCVFLPPSCDLHHNLFRRTNRQVPSADCSEGSA